MPFADRSTLRKATSHSHARRTSRMATEHSEKLKEPDLHRVASTPLAMIGDKSFGGFLTVGKNATQDPLGPPEVPEGRLSAFVVRHWLFRYGINLIIILAVIEMGLEVEFSSHGLCRAYEIWGIFYTAISTLEMFLMIETYRLSYFQTRWMLLDFGLAIASILDTIILPRVGFAEDFRDFFSLVRLLRVLRIVKVTKVFPGFAVIMDGLLQSFQSMFWIFGLLFLILYAGSICCVSILGGPGAGFPGYNESEAKSQMLTGFNNYEYFGTLFRSMLTLLSMLLLSEWPVVRKIAEVHIGMVPLFLFLLVLVSFGVTNVIIGIVVEKTTEAMEIPAQDELARDMEFKAHMAEDLASLLYDMDLDGDGRASLAELEAGLGKIEFKEKLDSLDLPYDFKTLEFLCMLDLDGNGKLSKHEFVTGLLRLIFSNDWQRQCLHAMEVGMLHYTVVNLGKDLKAELRSSIRELKSEIRTLLSSDIEGNSCKGSSGPCEFQPSPGEVRLPLASWEPLPTAALFQVAGQDHETHQLPPTECLPPNKIADGQVHGCKRVPHFETMTGPPVFTPLLEQGSPFETATRPQAPLLSDQGKSDQLDCQSEHDVMAAPENKTQVLQGVGAFADRRHVQPCVSSDGDCTQVVGVVESPRRHMWI